MNQPELPRRRLTSKLTALGATARSALRRYPEDVAASVRQRNLKADAAKSRLDGDSELGAVLPLRELWNAVPSQAGKVSALTWLGHCSVLLKIGSTTVLTDPVFSDRIGVRLGPLTIGPSRVGDVLPHIEDLPAADLVLLSHAHFDHLDRPTLRRLIGRDTHIVTAKGTGRLVPRGFGSVQELAWDEELDVCGLNVKTVRPAHWGARTVWDRHRGFNSYILATSAAAEQGERDRVLFAGDTAATKAFDGLGPFEYGIFGIGAYHPWIDAHANPEQAYAMAKSAGVKTMVPVHHSTFRLSDEPMHEPLERLLAAAGAPVSGEAIAAGAGPRVAAMRVGELHRP